MRLLIANRGEIAVRIAEGARRQGIETVAVYSDADRRSLHVRSCDQAVRIGASEAASSYLDIDAVLEAAARSGATAVHPGYGFLAENTRFARAVIAAGLTWVGPHPDAIDAMGSKINARGLAEEAGVPIIPGYNESQDPDALAAAAERIGYPVMIKASAGGGGKGIRVVEFPGDFHNHLRDAKEEARRGFGDDSMIVERYITRPRHVEVQIVGDTHGTVLHFGTRECSVQRRHQKVLEEAPAPWLPDETRRGLHDAAVRLGEAIGYDNAGTVEFIVDDETGDFFFLEMNTRLQVEHPVTEMVTGVDLVALQLLVAEGGVLPLTQDEIGWTGHAIEARLNAEDPWRGFLPQTGRIAELDVPAGVRWDAGISQGSEVSAHYDSMVAKVIAHGEDREVARRRLLAAMGELHVVGLRTNQAMLSWLLAHEALVAGPVTTRFLDEEPLPEQPDEAIAAEFAALAHLATRDAAAPLSPWSASGPARFTPHSTPRVVVLEGLTGTHEFAVEGFGGTYRVGGRSIEVEVIDTQLVVEHDGVVDRMPIAGRGSRMAVAHGGTSHAYRVIDREERWLLAADHDASGAGDLTSPFPGLVVAVAVVPGQEVHEGDLLVTLEAMKMLHSLTAAGHGVIEAVLVDPGMAVEQGASLVTIATDDDIPED